MKNNRLDDTDWEFLRDALDNHQQALVYSGDLSNNILTGLTQYNDDIKNKINQMETDLKLYKEQFDHDVKFKTDAVMETIDLTEKIKELEAQLLESSKENKHLMSELMKNADKNGAKIGSLERKLEVAVESLKFVRDLSEVRTYGEVIREVKEALKKIEND